MPALTKLSTKPASPKFSMAPRRETSSKNLTPGPGTYAAPDVSVHKEKASEAYGFGSAPKLPSNVTGHPGPGAYQPHDPTKVSSKYGFGSADRAAAAANVEQPGPGAYDAKAHVGSGGPAHSMAPRREVTRPSSSPGPGCYGTSDAAARNKARSFGTAPRDDSRDQGHPGPGSYQHDDRPRGPNFSMRPKAQVAKREEGPGPGSYTHHGKLGREGSQYSLGARRDSGPKNVSPGPGAYASPDVSSHKEKNSEKYGFGTSPKHSRPANTHPGPGAYAHDDKKRGPQFSMRSKATNAPRAEHPGPGSYDSAPLVGSSGPSYSVAPRRDAGPRVTSPGPGCYASPDVSVHKEKKSEAHGFGSAPRDLERDNGHPGPGSYSAVEPNNVSSKYGFGTGTRAAAPVHDQPGPGAYATKEHVGREGPGYSVAPRRDAAPKVLSPGPGHYSAPDISSHKEKRSEAYGFGTAARDPSKDSGHPGPGSYAHDNHLQATKPAGPGYTMRSKPSPGPQHDQPGPGAYDHAVHDHTS